MRVSKKEGSDAELYQGWLEAATPFSSMNPCPYLGDEVFYDTEINHLNKNWVLMGLYYMVNSRFKLEFNYLHQSALKNQEWLKQHILRIQLKITL